MESSSSEELRKRHPVISHKTIPQETAIKLANLASNPRFFTSLEDDEITSALFQTRAGSPSNSQAQAVKFMEDLSTVVGKKDRKTDQLFRDAVSDNDDDAPLESIQWKR